MLKHGSVPNLRLLFLFFNLNQQDLFILQLNADDRMQYFFSFQGPSPFILTKSVSKAAMFSFSELCYIQYVNYFSFRLHLKLPPYKAKEGLKFENRSSCRAVLLNHVLRDISVSGTTRHEIRICALSVAGCR